MISKVHGVLEPSDFYMYTAGFQAKKLFFYPLCVGHFFYSPDYQLSSRTYDSFLLMYIKQGTCIIETKNQCFTAHENQIVFLDCYEPHIYYTKTGWEAEWLHFDGPVAREYFNLITEFSHVFSLKEDYIFCKNLNKLYMMFKNKSSIKEAVISQYITNLLTELLISNDYSPRQTKNTDMIEDTIAYINEHLRDNITLEQLAATASLSPYYFTRLFKRETGFTPHEYIIAARLNLAKFQLKNTNHSIKDICFSCGFSSESSFCSTFKKWENITPLSYRLSLKDTIQD
jgi:AraC-like DNA-binding protein